MTLSSKVTFLRELLQKSSAFVHFDPRPESVLVPKHLKNDAQLVLQLGYNLVVPIPDLKTDDPIGFSGTLSFSRTPFRIFVPWRVVYCIVNDTGDVFQMWPDAFTAEVAAAMAAQMVERAMTPAVQPTSAPLRQLRPNPAGLRLVKSE